MALIELKCPQCQCQVLPPQAGASGMHCPRCLHWLDFDPLCLGSCLSCHKMQQRNPEPCIAGQEEKVNTEDLSMSQEKSTVTWLGTKPKGWQDLFSWMSSGK